MKKNTQNSMAKVSKGSEKGQVSIDDSIESFVENVANKPEAFVASEKEKKQLEENVMATLKKIFDFAAKQKISVERGKKGKKRLETTPLDELIINDVDSEQIWEQILLHHNPLLKYIDQTLNKQFEGKEDGVSLSDLLNEYGMDDQGSDEEEEGEEGEDFDGMDSDEEISIKSKRQLEDDEEEEEEEGEEGEEFEDEEGEEGEDDEEDEEEENKGGKSKDRFFSQDRMMDFVEEMEKREMEGGDFLDLDVDDEEEGEGIGMGKEDAMYEDFFDDGPEDQEEGDEEEDNEDDLESEFLKEGRGTERKEVAKGGLSKLFDEQEEDLELGTGLKSAFQRREELNKQRIEKLEEAAVSSKPWTMSGEVKSKKRPLNSLLEAELDFESSAKPVPIITEETTNSVEEIIKQRIRDGSYDDVIRKKIIQTNWKPRMELDHEKSKMSLSEIYEKEYETQVMGKKKEETPLDKIHTGIVAQFKKLCNQLDALSNFHFTPKEVQPDTVIKQKEILPSIAKEDITPLVHSKEMQLTASEIYAPQEKSRLARLDAAKEHGEITQAERSKRRALIKKVHQENKAKDAKREKEKELADPLYAQKKLQSKKGEEEARKKITEHRNTSFAKNATDNVTGSTGLFQQLQREMEGKASPKAAPKEKKATSSSKFKL